LRRTKSSLQLTVEKESSGGHAPIDFFTLSHVASTTTMFQKYTFMPLH